MSREVMKLALEALDELTDKINDDSQLDQYLDVMDALREALAQPWTPEDMAYRPGGLAQPDTDMSYTIALQRAIEWHCDGKAVPPSVAESCPYHAEKLNQALAQPAREPLTVPQIIEVTKKLDLDRGISWIVIIRAIEAAHDIGNKT